MDFFIGCIVGLINGIWVGFLIIWLIAMDISSHKNNGCDEVVEEVVQALKEKKND